jgi:hypothetical protein
MVAAPMHGVFTWLRVPVVPHSVAAHDPYWHGGQSLVEHGMVAAPLHGVFTRLRVPIV